MEQTPRKKIRLAIARTFKAEPDAPEVERLADEILAICADKTPARMSDPAWLMAAGKKIDATAQARLKQRREATDEFERALRFNPLPWGKDKDWERFEQLVVDTYEADNQVYTRFNVERAQGGQFSKLPTNSNIIRNLTLTIALWPSWFPAPESAADIVNEWAGADKSKAVSSAVAAFLGD